jgi:hypothetical protein
MEAKCFRFDAKKCYFRLFSHLKQNENEIKRKQSEKTFISFRFEAKRKDRKRNEAKTKKFWKQNKAKIRSINIALAGGEKFEAKRSEKKMCFHVSVRNACETDLVSLRFTLKR